MKVDNLKNRKVNAVGVDVTTRNNKYIINIILTANHTYIKFYMCHRLRAIMTCLQYMTYNIYITCL